MGAARRLAPSFADDEALIATWRAQSSGAKPAREHPSAPRGFLHHPPPHPVTLKPAFSCGHNDNKYPTCRTTTDYGAVSARGER